MKKKDNKEQDNSDPNPERERIDPADSKVEDTLSQPPDEPEVPKDEGNDDRLLRLQADFDNYRKRVMREKSEWSERALEGLIEELLSVLDHFEMGLQTAREHNTDESVIEGFRLVYEQLMTAIKKVGVSIIDAAGQTFDPNLHEAITCMPSDEVPADTVIEQSRRGYMLGRRLLRPAQVVVSSGPVEA